QANLQDAIRRKPLPDPPFFLRAPVRGGILGSSEEQSVSGMSYPVHDLVRKSLIIGQQDAILREPNPQPACHQSLDDRTTQVGIGGLVVDEDIPRVWHVGHLTLSTLRGVGLPRVFLGKPYGWEVVRSTTMT